MRGKKASDLFLYNKRSFKHVMRKSVGYKFVSLMVAYLNIKMYINLY